MVEYFLTVIIPHLNYQLTVSNLSKAFQPSICRKGEYVNSFYSLDEKIYHSKITKKFQIDEPTFENENKKLSKF